MSTTLQPVSDPVQAHNLWKAGLLVNSAGSLWNTYAFYADTPGFDHPDGIGFQQYGDDWFICLEE